MKLYYLHGVINDKFFDEGKIQGETGMGNGQIGYNSETYELVGTNLKQTFTHIPRAQVSLHPLYYATPFFSTFISTIPTYPTFKHSVSQFPSTGT
jgi:hypothetical protein